MRVAQFPKKQVIVKLMTFKFMVKLIKCKPAERRKPLTRLVSTLDWSYSDVTLACRTPRTENTLEWRISFLGSEKLVTAPVDC